MMLKVAIVVIPEAFPHSIIEPLDVFTRCQTIYQHQTGERITEVPQVALVGESSEHTIELNGIRISPTHDITTPEQFDVIWIPFLMIDDELSYRRRKKMQHWIKDQLLHGAQVATVGTGAFLLAETGLINYRETALNRSYSYLFSDIYPLVKIKPQVAVHCEDWLYSAAADSDWISLATEVLEMKYGKVFSAKTAEMFIFNSYKREVKNRANHIHDAIVAKAEAWISEHISEDNLVSRAAMEFGLSESSLTRRFKAAHRESVMNFIQNLRIQRAKEALEMTKLPVERICDLVGYRDSSYFRRLFKIKTGMTPNQYRKQCCT